MWLAMQVSMSNYRNVRSVGCLQPTNRYCLRLSKTTAFPRLKPQQFTTHHDPSQEYSARQCQAGQATQAFSPPWLFIKHVSPRSDDFLRYESVMYHCCVTSTTTKTGKMSAQCSICCGLCVLLTCTNRVLHLRRARSAKLNVAELNVWQPQVRMNVWRNGDA
jgi:hypothetical protein